MVLAARTAPVPAGARGAGPFGAATAGPGDVAEAMGPAGLLRHQAIDEHVLIVADLCHAAMIASRGSAVCRISLRRCVRIFRQTDRRVSCQPEV